MNHPANRYCDCDNCDAARTAELEVPRCEECGVPLEEGEDGVCLDCDGKLGFDVVE